MLHGQQTRVKVITSRSPDVTSNTCWQWDLLCKSLTTGVFRRCFPRKLRSPRDTLALSPPRTLLFPRHGDQQHTVVCRAEFKLQVRKKKKIPRSERWESIVGAALTRLSLENLQEQVVTELRPAQHQWSSSATAAAQSHAGLRKALALPTVGPDLHVQPELSNTDRIHSIL